MSDQPPERTPNQPPTADGQTIPEATPSRAALATAATSVAVPGYDILGELGRGGMGAVLRGRDPELGRELAVKVLLERHHGDARTAERFREEAQVGGQLQHPGVVPVYALGRLSDGRPFFTMKLVEGRTLAALLKERPSPAHELPRFLHVFEQICQTLAYAHSRGVIHRDLKPLNIMVGAFGEVQVMDWGLAKVARDGAVRTERSGRPESESAAGSVLGTPAYMAPEQACGDVEGLDARCDVFGLGAVLCEVLTGAPPYRGRETGELLRKAARADLADAFGRLDGCGADGELLALAKACLSAEASDRPEDAGLVASAMTAHLAGVQERLRQAELAKVAAQARAAEERKRRRLTLALAATVLLAVVGAGTAAFWVQTEHARRAAATERDATAALQEAATLGEQAKTLKDDPARWEAALTAALSAVKRADGLLRGGEGAEALRPRVDALRAELEAADRDCKMIARLDEARQRGAAAGEQGGFDRAGAAALYAEAFRQDDPDWDSLTADQAAERLNRRAVRDELLAGLADWQFTTYNRDEKKRLFGILQAADPDPSSYRNRWNAAMAQRDGDTLERLVFDPEAREQPTARLIIMARGLTDVGAVTDAVRLLTDANDRRPGDFWINFELAYALNELRPAAADEVVCRYTAAVALRPGSLVAHNNLGNALSKMDRFDEAIDEYRESIALKPDYPSAHNNLANALHDKGRLDEAVEEHRKAIALAPGDSSCHANLGGALADLHRLDEALAECRRAIELNDDNAGAHNNLGNVLLDLGRLDEALAECRRAVELDGDNDAAHNNLGHVLHDKGRLDDAIAEYRKAIALKPTQALAHSNLGNALDEMGRFDEALAECRRAVELNPGLAGAHLNFGVVLDDKGRPDDAIAECRKALDLDPHLAKAHNTLANALFAKGRLDDALAEYREAVALQPDFAMFHWNLGGALYKKGRLDEALVECRKGVELAPDSSSAHHNLGLVLHDKGKWDEAVAEHRKAIDLDPNKAEAHADLGAALREKGRLDEAIAEGRRAVELKPESAVSHFDLALALQDKRLLDDAVAEYRKALQYRPAYPEAHNNLANTLSNIGRLDEAIAEYHKALDLNPDAALTHSNLSNTLRLAGRPDEAIAEGRRAVQLQDGFAGAHINLGNALRDKGLVDEAAAEFRRAVELKPDDPLGWARLGLALREQGRFAESLAAYRRCDELGSKDPGWRRPSADWVREAAEIVRLDALLPVVVSGAAAPATPLAGMRFAVACSWKRRYGAAARLFAGALAADPKLADDLSSGARYLAVRAAARAGCGQGEDAATLDDAGRAHWRKQALSWLRADLVLWTKRIAVGKPDERAAAAKALADWQDDPALTGVRDADAVMKLAAEEREAWRQLWADVDAALKKARAK